MAIKFDSNQNKVPLESLNVNDTFVFDNRLGLVIECEVYDMEWNASEPKRFWVDLSTGKDFMKDEHDQMNGTELVTPVELIIHRYQMKEKGE